MENCFVIQPFDEGKYDKRYVDIFKPAIEKAKLNPYRIDKDLSVRIPIDDIEKGIAVSLLCFAEISTDNPNVWYELGYAFACNKDVVMVCSEERTERFPFDIQHRHVIKYKTSSKSDFENLEDIITKKISAFMQNKQVVRKLNSTPVIDTVGLKSHEIAMLILIAQNQVSIDDYISAYNLKTEMNQAGYTDIATSVGIRSLKKKGLITISTELDSWNNQFSICRLSENGERWILENEDKFQFRKSKNESQKENSNNIDDLPF